MASMALAVADRAYVLQNSVVKLEGESAAVAQNPDVVRLYLGGSRHRVSMRLFVSAHGVLRHARFSECTSCAS